MEESVIETQGHDKARAVEDDLQYGYGVTKYFSIGKRV